MSIGKRFLIVFIMCLSVPALAQQRPGSGDSDEDLQFYEDREDAEAQSRAAADASYRVVYQSEPTNTRAGLGIGLAMPGFLTFQAFYQSFSAIVDGLYMDFRLTGSTFAERVYGGEGRLNSPLFENTFETDFRIGFGTRNTEPRRATITDSNGNKFQGRIPDSFGIAPFIGWRGRWGYDMQALRLGIHVERDVDAEVVFGDGRPGQSFQQWAVDFEVFYALRGDRGQEGFGTAFGFDYFFNNFLFTRGELGFALPNEDELEPSGIPAAQYEYANGINALDGFFWKLLIGFSYQFNVPNVSDKQAARNIEPASEEDLVPAGSQQQQQAADDDGEDEETEEAVEVEEEEPAAAPRRPRECERSADCDDGIFCNGQETCTGGVCMPGSIEDDGIECTQTVCDEEAQEIRHEPIHSLCGDGQFCNGAERCSPQTGCTAGNPPPVDDGDPCTNDFCDESMDRLVNEPIPNCEADEE